MANKSAARVARILPRFIRAGEAYGYQGMCREESNNIMRPNVRKFPIGKLGVGVYRLELDAWADDYVESKSTERTANQDNHQPRSERQRDNRWREKKNVRSLRAE